MIWWILGGIALFIVWGLGALIMLADRDGLGVGTPDRSITNLEVVFWPVAMIRRAMTWRGP